MNKLTKAAIAGAAGIALLLGGAGSLALWNDTASLGGGEIQAGTLSITAEGGSWDSAPALWVPGDTFTYTDTLTIDATGDNLTAVLSVNPASITGGAALKAALVVTLSTDDLDEIGSTGTYTVTSSTPSTVEVTVTVTFPSSVSGLTAQGENVDLSGLSFLLVQQ